MAESIMLCRFSLQQNSNKFYEIKLLDNDVVKCRYGRVGQNGLTVEYRGGKRKYESIIREKTSNKKGYKKVDLEIVSDANGRLFSEDHQYGNIAEIALSQINCLDNYSRTLIQNLSKENIHNIVESTDVVYDDETGSFKTPLGIITLKSINRSFDILEEIKKRLSSYNFKINEIPKDELQVIDELNAEYFVLVPTKIRDTTQRDLLIYSEKNIEVQSNICDMLFDTVKLTDDLKEKQKEMKNNEKDKTSHKKVFDVSISKLEDKKEFDRINKYFERTKNGMHGKSLNNSKITNIYNITLGAQQEPFKESLDKLGNVEELFHGTKIANMLSILSKGLLLPGQTPGAITASMFGKGLYFANQSTKSAQYCDGMFYGGGRRRRFNYMFIAQVVMGKSYVPEYCEKKIPKGFDSFHAKAGISGVKNDEIIIFNSSQVRLTHVIEIEIN